MKRNTIIKISVLALSLFLLLGAGRSANAQSANCDALYTTYENCYNLYDNPDVSCAYEWNAYEQCYNGSAQTCDTGMQAADGTCYYDITSYCDAVDDPAKCGTSVGTDCSQWPGTVAENGECVPVDSNGWTQSTCVADGGSWEGGRCVEGTGSDCSQYPGTVADGSGNCVAADSQTTCSQTNGVWKNNQCFANNDEYCQAAYDPTYSWSTLYQSCVGGLGTECNPQASTDICYGVPCACTANSSSSLGGTCQGSGCRTAPSGTGGTSGGSTITTTQATTIIDKNTGQPVSVPAGSTIDTTTGAVYSSSGQQLLPPGSVQNSASSGSGDGSLTLCANGILYPVCDSSTGGSVSTTSYGGGGGGLPYNPGYTGGATGPKCGDPAAFKEIGGVCFPVTTGLSDAPVYVILSNLFSWLMGLFTTFAIMAFVVSGIQYLTAAGSEDQIERAKHNATYALLGVVVGLSGFIIIQAVVAALSGQSYFF